MQSFCTLEFCKFESDKGNYCVNMMVFKAAVLLGAPEDRASKEMGEVIDFMGKLFNLTKNFCSKASNKIQ